MVIFVISTPLLIIWSLDEIKEDVQKLVPLFGLWMKASCAQDEGNQLLMERRRGDRDTVTPTVTVHTKKSNRPVCEVTGILIMCTKN